MTTPKMATTVSRVRPTRRVNGRATAPGSTAAGADAAGGPQPPEAHRAHAEAVLGDGRQQGHRAAEQHGEQVEGDGAEQDGLAADEAQPLQRLVHRRWVAAPGRRRPPGGRRTVGRGRMAHAGRPRSGRPWPR